MAKDIIERLQDLYKVDVDAIAAYGQAIENIKNTHISSKLHQFRGDHERHLSALADLIQKKGGQVPERSKDFKGFFIKGMTSLRSSLGDEQALKAMRQNETLTNKKYREAVEELKDYPDVARVLNQNYSDEQRHLSFIEESISEFEGRGASAGL